MAKTDISDEAAREEILRMALNLYRKTSPLSVTMDDVATAMGRSRTSLYYYFKNKDEIYQAVLELIVQDVTNIMRKAVAAQNTLNAKIYAFCTAKLKTSEEWKTIFKAMWVSMNGEEQSKHSKGMSSLHKKLIYQESLIIKETISQAIARNEIRAITVTEQDMVAFIISSGLRGIRNEIFDQDDPHDIKAAINMLAEMAIKWLEG